MDFWNAVIDGVAVITAHVMSGLFAAPLKYKKWTSVLIWCVWGVVQAVLFIPAMTSTADKVFGFIFGFVTPYVGQYVLFFITTKGKFAKRLFTIITYSVFFCIYMAIATSVIGSFPNLHWGVASLIRIVLLFVVVFIFLKKVCPLFWNNLSESIKSWWLLVFADAVFLLAVVSSSVFPNKIESVKNPYFIAFLTLVIAIVSVYPIIFISIKNMAVAEREKRSVLHNELLLSQVKSQEKEVETARRTRHDQRQHYGMLLSYARNGEMEKLIQYLEERTESIDNLRQMVFCENDAINNILSVYANKASAVCIPMEIKASAKKELKASTSDLVTIMGNMLENALHGVQSSKAKSPIISVDIYHKDGKLVIGCKNSCKKNLDFDEIPDSLASIGIKSICSTVEKYNGICRFSACDGIFTVLIIMDS
jgi:hypothetical protein